MGPRPHNTNMVAGVHYAVGCWTWIGSIRNGYGTVTVQGHQMHAHRWAYLLAKGPIPKGLYVCHSCDNRLCVNPDHLWLGTAKENMRDASKKGRIWSRKWLTPAEVRYVLDSRLSCRVLAPIYGVSHGTIWRIRRKRR